MPRLLLLDEPFASLDLATRREMRRVVREVQESSGISMVFVTHSPREAIEMGITWFATGWVEAKKKADSRTSSKANPSRRG